MADYYSNKKKPAVANQDQTSMAESVKRAMGLQPVAPDDSDDATTPAPTPSASTGMNIQQSINKMSDTNSPRGVGLKNLKMPAAKKKPDTDDDLNDDGQLEDTLKDKRTPEQKAADDEKEKNRLW